MRRSKAMPRARGLTLVELMVALALGLLLVTVVLQGFAASATVAGVNASVSEYQTNGRYALEVLKREVRHAALHPLVWQATQFNINPTVSARDYGCGAGVSTDLRAGAGVLAWNDANPYPGSCLAATDDRAYVRGDVLMLRRAALERATAYDSNAPYARLTYGQANVFLGGEAAADLTPPTADHRLINDLYFVNDFTSSNTESPKVPALYRLTLGSGPNPRLVPELVASNVEHFQVQYGRQMDSTGGMRYFNANQISAADWQQVSTVRVWLLLRASVAEPGFTSGTYELGDVSYTPNDRFRRSVVSTTINLRNL
jgi:type IV pilus assembly protein PilW